MSLQPFLRPVGDVGLGAFTAEGPVITLEDLVQLDVRVTWDEAVSIVEELCVAAQGAVMRPIPAAKDIILNAAGTVTLRHSAAGVPDPIEAARRLHELLGGAVAPAPLRLFVSQAVSSGSYTSLSEFDDALAYYAKPGRQDRVKAVYQRASEQLLSKPQAQAALDAAKATAAPTVLPKLDRPSRPHHSWQTLALVGLAAAATATVVVGLGLYFWPKGSSESAATEAPAAEADAASAGGGGTAPKNAATATARAAGRAAGTERAAAKDPVSALDVILIPPTGSRAVRLPGSGGGGPRGAAGTASATERGLPDLGTAGTSTVPAAEPRGEGARVPPQAQQAAAGGQQASAFAPESQPLYSASDFTVQPAVLSKPQLLPPPFAGGGTGKPVRMELIISPAGTVERARFLEAPQRMADMMLLSSAKTWIFAPAMKDGQPVRYRTVVSWVGAP